MKAIRIHDFGGPEVLRLEDIERPTPASDEILVRVYASGVNPVDWAIREGGNDVLRPHLHLPMTLGCDMAGVVEAVGGDVTEFAPGDEVYGVPNFLQDGSYAEYCSARAGQFARKPKTISFAQAAAVPLAALTAWTGLYPDGKLQAGERVLITGASGGVGSFAVQFAKASGAYVIGVASTDNLDYLRETGADEVIDYRTQAVEEATGDIDLILEVSPLRDNEARLRAIGALKSGGRLVSVNVDFPFDDAVNAALRAKDATGKLSQNQPNGAFLTEIATLIDDGKVTVHVSETFPLEAAAQAHEISANWHTRGKLVLAVSKS